MQYAVCCVPVSPLRSEPSHKLEMVSQLLFGEKSIAIDQCDGWVKVRLKYDGYEGWCQQSHLAEIDEAHYTNVDKDLTAGWVNEVDYNGHRMNIPWLSILSMRTLPEE